MDQSVAAADSAKQYAARLRKAELASLRVGLLPSLSSALIAGALAEIAHRIPAIEVEIRSGDAAKLTEDLLQGELDAALMTTGEHLPERLDSWIMFREAYRVAFPPDHHFALLQEIPVEDLAGEILLERVGCDAIAVVRERCASHTGTLNVRHRGGDDGQLQHLAAAGLGLLLVPAHATLLPPLVARPLADPAPMREIALCTVGGRRRSPALDAFVRLIRARDFSPLLAAA
jgi:DNA-binding transcriptional LysR family regulator